MADLRFEAKNNQKKEISVFASGVIETSATMDDILFTLPSAALVTSVYAVVLTATGTVTNTVDIMIGTNVIADELVVGVTGVSQPSTLLTTSDAATVTVDGTPPVYFPTGGSVTVVAGADAPDALGRIKVVVEYIETELSEGTYTD